jgi:hypothetical protein
MDMFLVVGAILAAIIGIYIAALPIRFILAVIRRLERR